MKKYTDYFKIMMGVSFILMVCFILCTPQIFCLPDAGAAAAVGSMFTFIAAIMAPDHEKYEEHKRR